MSENGANKGERGGEGERGSGGGAADECRTERRKPC